MWRFPCSAGWEFNPAFFRKGIKRPYTLLKSREKYITAFVSLNGNPVDKKVFKILEEFLCRI